MESPNLLFLIWGISLRKVGLCSSFRLAVFKYLRLRSLYLTAVSFYYRVLSVLNFLP